MLQGRLKVFYDFSGELVELPLKDPSLDLKISNADPKAVRFQLHILLLNSSSCSTPHLHPFSSPQLLLLLFLLHNISSYLPLYRLLLPLLHPPAGDHHPEEHPQPGGGEEQPGGALHPPVHPGHPSLQRQLLPRWSPREQDARQVSSLVGPTGAGGRELFNEFDTQSVSDRKWEFLILPDTARLRGRIRGWIWI